MPEIMPISYCFDNQRKCLPGFDLTVGFSNSVLVIPTS
jgi:hypothetical protein